MSEPRVAVLSLTRDRLEYSRACFASLRENAGIRYTHFVLDQGSKDGTPAWLEQMAWQTTWGEGYKCPLHFWLSDTNLGIHAGMNFLLDKIAAEAWSDEDGKHDAYDLLVKVDNDCELLTPGTLKAVAEHVLENPDEPRVVSPLIHGLRNRPRVKQIRGNVDYETNGVGITDAIGGIFLPIPPSFLKAGFRYDEAAPVWGGDDERICAMAQEQGGYCGYLLDFEANHYRTTEGQALEQVEYFARRVREGGPAK